MEVMFSIHEMGGVHKGVIGEPGLDSQGAKELVPELNITEE